MKPRILSALAATAAALWLALPAASAAGIDADQARRIAEQFVAAKQGSPQESFETMETAVADLDGDGKDEIVVWWNMLGPTYWSHGVTVLAHRGQRYQPAGETEEALGNVEDMDVRNGVIRLQTKWPGPNDPRCCPSVAKTMLFRWQGNRLVPTK